MKRRMVLVALVLMLAVGAAVTFYKAQQDLARIPAEEPGVFTPELGPSEPEPGSGQQTPGPDVAVSKMVVSDEAGISVVMSIEPDQQTAENVVITLFINTHGGDLSKFNLARLTSVEVDGIQVNIDEIKFKEPNPGDPHHRSGSLEIPRTVDGLLWMDEAAAELQLIVDGIPKGTKREFAWEQPWQLAGYTP